MILSYNKLKLINDLKEYIKYRIISPTDYILVLNKNLSSTNSKLIANWNFTSEEISAIEENTDDDAIAFWDTDGIAIPYNLITIMTVEEYFDYVKRDMYDC